jgi:hypothetical protein
MDEQLRHLGGTARAEVEATIDPDRSWSAFREQLAGGATPVARRGTGDAPRSQHRSAWPWFAMAATLVAIVGGLVLLRNDDDSLQSTDPTTQPIETDPGATVAPPPTTSTPPTTSVVPGKARVIAVSYSDPPPAAVPTVFAQYAYAAPGQAETALAIGEQGVVSEQNGEFVIVGFSGVERRVAFRGDDGWFGFSAPVYGPGDVVYGLQIGGNPYEARVVAVALSGPRQGEIVARADGLSAATYAEVPLGALGHGPDGIVDLARDRGTTLMGYVDETGAPRGFDRAPASVPIVGNDGLVSAGPTRWQLRIDRAQGWSVGLTGANGAAPGPGGEVVYATTIGGPEDPTVDESPMTLPALALLRPDGSGRWVSLPDDWQFESSSPWGVLVSRIDGERLVRQFGLIVDDALAPTETTVVPPPTGAASWRDFPSMVSSIPRSCATEVDCTQIAADPDGTAVTYDPVGRTLTRHSIPPVETTVPAEWGQVWIEFAGPDDVVYLNIETGGENQGAIVAVALHDGDAGREIARWPGSDRVGDADLVAQPGGIVNVGCCGEERQRPESTDTVAIPWVDRSGASITSSIPELQLNWIGDALVIDRDGRSWTFDSLGDATLRGMSITATFDGGILAQISAISGSPTHVLRGWPDGTVDTAVLEEYDASLEPTGVAVFDDGDHFARVQLFADRVERWAGFLELDESDWSLSAPGLNDIIDLGTPGWAQDPTTFADAVVGLLGLRDTRSVRVLSDDGAAVLVEVVTADAFGDSGLATRQRLVLDRQPDGTLRFGGGELATVCQPNRGHQDFVGASCN